MRCAIAIFIAAFFAGACFGTTTGQVASTNAVKTAIGPTNQPPKWDGTVTVGVTATQGNVNSVLTTGRLVAQKDAKWNQYNLESDGAYGEVSSVKSAQSAHGSAQYNHIFVDDSLYSYGRGDALHDAIANVDYRLTSSVGSGLYFIKDKQTTLSSEVGPAVQYEKLDGEHHLYPSARMAENFEHKIDEHARVWENIEVIPPLTCPDAFLVNAEVGLETPLTHKLSLQTYLQDNFANQPAPGYKDNDLKLISGLVFKF